MDWLSQLFEVMPVRGRLDLRCSYGAPWRIDQGPGEAGEIPYHAVLGGSAVLKIAHASTSPSARTPAQANGSICYAATSSSLLLTIVCCVTICRRCSW